MSVSVIINHYKSPALLKTCLRSFESSEYKPREIIVVDSEAEHETARMVKNEFPDARYIPFEKNVGFGRLVNAGIEAASSPYLFIVNADTVVKKDTLGKLVACAEAEPRAGIIGPRLKGFDHFFQPSAFRFYTPLTVLARRSFLQRTTLGRRAIDRFLLRGEIHEGTREVTPVDWVMGSALFVRREAVEKVGLLDSRFFMYFEDVDWCRRFWEAGYRVLYFPEAECYHYHKRVSKGAGGILELLTNSYTRIHFASAVKYFLKHGLKTPKYGV